MANCVLEPLSRVGFSPVLHIYHPHFHSAPLSPQFWATCHPRWASGGHFCRQSSHCAAPRISVSVPFRRHLPEPSRLWPFAAQLLGERVSQPLPWLTGSPSPSYCSLQSGGTAPGTVCGEDSQGPAFVLQATRHILLLEPGLH